MQGNETTPAALDESGFAIVKNVLSRNEQTHLIEALGPVGGAGRRGLLGMEAVRGIACSARVLDLVRPHVAGRAQPVRSIYFDKTPGANWLVAWHQDLTLALAARADAPGFGPWSMKEGVPHAQPPGELLEQMLTVRLHLDDCDESNGALRVIPAVTGTANFPRSASANCARSGLRPCAASLRAARCSCARCCCTLRGVPWAERIAASFTSNMPGSICRPGLRGTNAPCEIKTRARIAQAVSSHGAVASPHAAANRDRAGIGARGIPCRPAPSG